MVTIHYAPNNKLQTTKRVDIDLPSLNYGRERASLDHTDMYKLIDLFGNGYGEHHFNLIVHDDGVMLQSCQMVEMGGPGGGARLVHDGITKNYPRE